GQDPVVYLYIFACIAVIILLLACTNYIILTTARAGNRTKEIGIRKVTGAYKKDLVMQFFGESMLLIAFAGMIGIIFACLFLPSFNALSSKNLSLNFAEDISLLFWLAAITIFTGIVSGSYPAIVLSSFKPVNILKGQLSLASSRSLLRKALVVGQFVVTAVLIASTLVMFRQIDFMLNKDLGFERENVLVFPLDTSLKANYDTIKEELLKSPYILNVSSASSLPLNVNFSSQVFWEGKTIDDQITMDYSSVDYDYFSTFNMQLIDGRAFSEEMSTDKNNYLINEKAAEILQLGSSPVGKMLTLVPNQGQIIGVVKNFHSLSLHNEVVPVVFTMNWQFFRNTMFIRIKEGSNSEALSYIQSKFNEVVQGTPFSYSYLEDSFVSQYSSDRQIFSILRNFAVLAIFISCLGILGLAAFLAEKRTKEIGIRKVLGASAENIAFLISKEFIYLIIIANIIGLPLSLFVINGLLDSYAFRTDIPFWTFIGAGVFTLTTAFITVSLQTLKAAFSNPVDSMKYE
ncbi:FtsX-like permease family protein, partial [candidate division KSB1 bacterium]